MKRSHDTLYLNEDNKSIKSSFRAVAEEIDENFSGSIADVGCAAGAFPAYLNSKFPNAKVTGIEFLESLRLKAEKDFSGVNFKFGDVTDRESIDEKFDIITMIGVLTIFDNFDQVLSNVLSWIKPSGTLILHNMISDFDIDVFIKYSKSSSSFNSNSLESGWNIISKKSLQLVAEKNSAKLISCYPFHMNVNLKRNADDVLRSWTESNPTGQLDIFNALHIRQPQQIAIVKKLPRLSA